MAVARVYSDSGNIIMEDASGHVIWSTERRPVLLLPDADAIILNNYSIEFPEFPKRFAYGYFRQGSGTNAFESGTSVLTIRPGEYPLPDIDLGALPAGVNYLDVRVNLTRTVNPVSMGAIDVPIEIAPGKTTYLPGGACEIEKFANFSRLFWFEIQAGRLILRRRQSVRRMYQPYVPSYTTNWTANAWSAGGGDLAEQSSPWTVMQTVQGTNVNNARARGGSQAARTDVQNFNTRSVYTGTITVRPGYIRCTGAGCAVNGGRSLQVTREPASGWRWVDEPGNYTRWTSQLISGQEVGTLEWNGQQVGAGIGPSITEFYPYDGWIYMRGPLEVNLPNVGGRYRIARRRETVVS